LHCDGIIIDILLPVPYRLYRPSIYMNG